MSSVSAFNHFHSTCRVRCQQQTLHRRCLAPSGQSYPPFSPSEKHGIFAHCRPFLTFTHKLKPTGLRFAAGDTQVPQQADEAVATTAVEQTVSVPVSSSDKLFMHFQAEGVMNEAVVPKVTKALEEVEGVSDVRVQVSEGIASVELIKETTIQATGVASSLVEIIQGSGFKLQTLNLSFDDEEEPVPS